MPHIKGTKWTRNDVVEAIREVMNSLHIERMPSKRECQKYYGDYSLTREISTKYGWQQFANELGLTLKSEEVIFGKEYEIKIANKLSDLGYDVKLMPNNFPYDLLVDDCVKIDVKASHLHQYEKQNNYSFSIDKPFATCDIYIFVSLDENDNVCSIYIIPSSVIMNNKQVTIGEISSQYNRFINRWYYIKDYSNFFDKYNEVSST